MSVSSVDVNTPPITTVASGRWTSDPAPVLSAIGTKPSAATSAVISTGLRRVAAAWVTASPSGWPLGPQLVDCGDQHDAVQHGHAEQRDETDRGREVEREPADPQRGDAADQRERHVEDHERRLSRLAERRKEQQKMIASDSGITSSSRVVARSWFSNCPPHSR